MKRFYKIVALTEKSDKGFGLTLDGKLVQTNARQAFIIPSLALANFIIKEWEEQKEDIIPDTMPLSQMAMTLIDRVIPHRQALTTEILDYINTDLICYRTDEPEDYKIIQEEKWNPFITWFQQKFGMSLVTTYQLSPITQSPLIHNAIQNYISNLNDIKFMAAYLATLGTGSIIMAISFVSQSFEPHQILKAAFAEEHLKDEIYLSSVYGAAPDQERKYKILGKELENLKTLISIPQETN